MSGLLVQSATKTGAQDTASAEQVRPDRAFGQPQQLAYLSVPPAFEIVQQYHFPLNLRKVRHAFSQLLPQFRTDRILFGIASRGRAVRFLYWQCPPYRLVAPNAVGAVPHDLQQPRTEPIRLPAVIQAFQRSDERVLAHILGVSGFADAGESHRVSHPKVTTDKCFEGCTVTLACQLDQASVGFRHPVIQTHEVKETLPTARQPRRRVPPGRPLVMSRGRALEYTPGGPSDPPAPDFPDMYIAGAAPVLARGMLRLGNPLATHGCPAAIHRFP
jgi:hypothetical protein